LSRQYGNQLNPKAPTRDFKLPNLDEREEAPEYTGQSVDYKFVAFGDESEEVALTLAAAEEKAEEIKNAAQIEAEELVAGGRAEAERLKAEAESLKQEAARIHKEARDKGHEEGFQKGYAQGEEKGLKDFEQAVAPALDSFKDIENLYEDLWRVNEPQLVKLATRVAEKVIYHELITSPDVVAGAFKAALDRLQEHHQALFRVNPEDLSHLEKVRGELKDRIKGLVKITFEPDSNLDRGELIMETESGRLDATLRNRIEAVLGAVDEVLEDSFGLNW
jgi:flagellar assembly protein FliH